MSCEYCKYFDAVESRYSNHGLCRRNPPMLNPHASGVRWPEVQITDWCGEFEQDTSEKDG